MNEIEIRSDIETVQTALEKLKEDDIDTQAIAEFLIFEHTIGKRTFLKNVIWLPMASFWILDCDTNKLTECQYSFYNFMIKNDFKIDEEMLNLYQILIKSLKKIKTMAGANKTYGIGLSGGLDSRLVASISKGLNFSLKSYIFGEPNSDAYYIANKIAKKIQTELTYPGQVKVTVIRETRAINYAK